MKSKLMFPIVVLALATACGRDSANRTAQKDYEVVQEGSANGVTSTIQGPGETLPPVTGTNADTTTAFGIDPNAISTSTGTFAGTLPPAYTPAYTPPAPRPEPAAPRPEPPPHPRPVTPPSPTPKAEPPPPTMTDTASAPEPEPEEEEEDEAPPPTTTDTRGQ